MTLQVLSAFLAIRLSLISGRRTAGLLILAAIALMLFRRSLSLNNALRGDPVNIDFTAEVIALIISVLSLIGILYVIRLVQSVKRTTESLRDSEKRYHSLFDQSPDGIVLIDEKGNIVDFNETAHRQLEYSRDEFAHLNLSDINPVESPEEIKAMIKKVADAGMAEFEVRHKTKNGGIKDVRVIAKLIALSGRTVFHTVWRDITEETKVEKALRESEKFLQTIVGTAPTCIKLLTADGHLQSMNSAGLAMIEADSIDEVRGRSIYSLVSEEHREAFKAMTEDVFRGESGSLGFKMIGLKGRPLWLYTNAVPMRDEKGEIISQLAVTVDITDQKIAEEKLRKSESTYRELVESVNSIVLRWNNEGSIHFMNAYGLSFFGYASDEVIGKNVMGTIVPETETSGRDLAEMIRDVSSHTENFLHTEHENICKSGRRVWISWTNKPIFDEQGNVIEILSIGNDLTGRREADKALQENELRLKKAQHIAHVGDWEWEVASGRVHWSDELYRIYGYAPREIAPDYGLVVEAMHPKSRDVFLSAIDAALKGERPFELDYSFFRRDGSEAFLHTIGQVIRGNDGAPVRMVGIVQDITEQKQAEEALRESEEKFRSIFDTANDGILIADISTRKFIEANNTMCAMLGYDRKEIANLGIADIHPLRDLSHILEQFGKQMRGEKTIVGDLPVKRKDGSVFYADVCASLIVLGGEQYAVGIFRDITERKHAEEKMKNALREKEILLKEIHHRVKNNLQIVASMLRLQSVKIRDGDARILFEASRNRVLTMSLIHEQLYRTENLAHIDFRAYVEELVANVFALAPENASQIKKQIDVEEVVLAVDHAIPCGLIINELVSNALRHAFPGGKAGTIVIGMRRDNGGGIVLLVTDNGTGLPEGADPMQTKTLGLQLVHSLAKQLNGTIEVDKIGGTSVRITFQT